MAMEAMTRMAMEAMSRMAMKVMPRVVTGVTAWVVTGVTAWVASEDMEWVALEVMAREASEVAFGLLTASPTMVLDLMANLKAMVSSLLPLLPMASNLNLLTLPRMAKRRSNLPNISHPNSLSLPSNLPTSNLVTLEHLPMDISSLPTLKALPGSASSPVPGY